jgi:hypothetical protein
MTTGFPDEAMTRVTLSRQVHQFAAQFNSLRRADSVTAVFVLLVVILVIVILELRDTMSCSGRKLKTGGDSHMKSPGRSMQNPCCVSDSRAYRGLELRRPQRP